MAEFQTFIAAALSNCIFKLEFHLDDNQLIKGL